METKQLPPINGESCTHGTFYYRQDRVDEEIKRLHTRVGELEDEVRDGWHWCKCPSPYLDEYVKLLEMIRASRVAPASNSPAGLITDEETDRSGSDAGNEKAGGDHYYWETDPTGRVRLLRKKEAGE